MPLTRSWTSRIAAMDEAGLDKLMAMMAKAGPTMLRQQLAIRPDKERLAVLAGGYAQADRRAMRQVADTAVAEVRSGSVLRALADFSGPVLYLRGQASGDYDGRAALERAGAVCRTIGDAGHFPHIDNPGASCEALFTFAQASEAAKP